MNRQEVLELYETEPSFPHIIKTPGKFEGEPIWTPYFWDMVMQGFGEDVFLTEEEDSECETIILISTDDILNFPELSGWDGKQIFLSEDNSGFVYSYLGSIEEE